jgi:hypothetical protein
MMRVSVFGASNKFIFEESWMSGAMASTIVAYCASILGHRDFDLMHYEKGYQQIFAGDAAVGKERRKLSDIDPSASSLVFRCRLRTEAVYVQVYHTQQGGTHVHTAVLLPTDSLSSVVKAVSDYVGGDGVDFTLTKQSSMARINSWKYGHDDKVVDYLTQGTVNYAELRFALHVHKPMLVCVQHRGRDVMPPKYYRAVVTTLSDVLDVVATRVKQPFRLDREWVIYNKIQSARVAGVELLFDLNQSGLSPHAFGPMRHVSCAPSR